MTIAVRDLTALNAAEVTQNLAETATRVQEANPTLDVRFGVLHNVVAYLHAALATGLQMNVEDYLSARSLADIQADPALADPAVVNGVLSNFGLTRLDGTAATGVVSMVVSTPTTVTTALGATFQAGGQVFQTTSVYTAKSDPAQINNSSDRLMTLLQDGNYLFTLPVVAAAVGPTAVTKDTIVAPDAPPNSYVTSYATSDFTGGLPAETNSELLLRMQQGVACKTTSNRVSMTAMLRNIPTFARFVASSIVGMGDAEMVRDRHWIFPFSGGGRVDWYVRTQEQLLRLGLTKAAVCVSKDAGGSTWQFSLSRDDAPGFYEVANIRPAAAQNVFSGFGIVSDSRAVDLTGPVWKPDVATVAESAYSRFQTTVIQFYDTLTDPTAVSVGSSALYSLEARCLPLIGELQDTLGDRDIRPAACDLLVKAPVPCFVSVSFTVNMPPGTATPDTTAVAAAMSHAAATTGFTGGLYAGSLHAVIAPLLPDRARAGALDMFGRIRCPNGTTRYLRSQEALLVQDDPSGMVTARTVQFFLSPDDVAITVVTDAPGN